MTDDPPDPTDRIRRVAEELGTEPDPDPSDPEPITFKIFETTRGPDGEIRRVDPDEPALSWEFGPDE